MWSSDSTVKALILHDFFFFISFVNMAHMLMWWLYPAGQLNPVTTTLSLPKGKGEKTMKRSQALR